MRGTLNDVIFNGTRMPEAGINAAIVYHFGVPVVLVAGDGAICRQAREVLGDVVPNNNFHILALMRN